MLITASTTSGQRGGLFGRNGMASLVNFGVRPRVADLAAHPDGDARRSPDRSCGMAGQTV